MIDRRVKIVYRVESFGREQLLLPCGLEVCPRGGEIALEVTGRILQLPSSRLLRPKQKVNSADLLRLCFHLSGDFEGSREKNSRARSVS